MRITEVSIDNRTSVFILVTIIVIMGMVSYGSLPREASPDVQIPLVIVHTVYFGVSPEDIETLITQHIEREINAISEVKEITSSSIEGVSIVRVEFESGFDIDDALQKVRDKVDKAEADLPEDVEKPEIIEINFSEFPIMTFNITGPQGLVKLKDIAEDVKDDIENINGVLDVVISGGLEREVQVNVDFNKLVHYNITFDDVIGAISSENQTIPGGSIDVNNSSFLVRIPGEFEKPFIIDDLVVKADDGKPIYVRDVAEVDYSFEDRNTYSRLNGEPCVTLDVKKRLGANIIDIADGVKQIIQRYDDTLPDNINFHLTVDFSKDINRTVKNLENNIFSGLVLVVIVLFTLLGLRNALFVAIAIPLSMLVSFIVLQLLGVTLNFVVLFSLILALGMLVDNAIVIIENIYKFLEEGHDLISAAKKGAAEVAWPITTSTLTTLTAFAPLMFWPGVVGDFMKYLPLTLIITLASSLFVALIINPVFASVFMKLEDETTEKPKSLFAKITYPFQRMSDWARKDMLPKTIDRYEKMLNRIIGPAREPGKKIDKRNWFGLLLSILLVFVSSALIAVPAVPNYIVLPLTILAGIGVIMVYTNVRLRVLAGAVLLLIIIMNVYGEFGHGVEFFPETDPERVYVSVESPTGTNIERSNELAKILEEKMKPLLDKDVSELVTNVGSSNNPFDAGGQSPNKSIITVQYVDYEEREQSSTLTTDNIRDLVSNIPGAEIEVQKEANGPPVGKPVNIEIIGENIQVLGSIADRIKDEIKSVDGVVDLKDDFDTGKPEIRVEVDREKAALFELNTTKIANNIRIAINGFEASKYRINEEEYDITVRLKKKQRESVDILNTLRINYVKEGKTESIPLISLADIRYDKGPGAIKRKDLKRVVTVTSNVAEGYNENEVLGRVQAELADFELPPDYRLEYTGQSEEQEEAAGFLSRAFLIAFLGIFLIMVIQFNSLGQPVIIMSAVAISLIGVFIGLIVFAMPFGIIMTGIGVISLAGVVVNNNIVLIDYINILRGRGQLTRDAVINAGLRRFRPVTLTAITTILGLIPLTFGFGFDIYTMWFSSGGAEAEFWRSMGVAVIFGLMFGTILTLVVVPVIYSIIYDLPDALRATFNMKKKTT